MKGMSRKAYLSGSDGWTWYILPMILETRCTYKDNVLISYFNDVV